MKKTNIPYNNYCYITNYNSRDWFCMILSGKIYSINPVENIVIDIPKEAPEEEILKQAKVAVAKWLEGKEIKFSKIVPGKLVALVGE